MILVCFQDGLGHLAPRVGDQAPGNRGYPHLGGFTAGILEILQNHRKGQLVGVMGRVGFLSFGGVEPEFA